MGLFGLSKKDCVTKEDYMANNRSLETKVDYISASIHSMAVQLATMAQQLIGLDGLTDTVTRHGEDIARITQILPQQQKQIDTINVWGQRLAVIVGGAIVTTLLTFLFSGRAFVN